MTYAQGLTNDDPTGRHWITVFSECQKTQGDSQTGGGTNRQRLHTNPQHDKHALGGVK